MEAVLTIEPGWGVAFFRRGKKAAETKNTEVMLVWKPIDSPVRQGQQRVSKGARVKTGGNGHLAHSAGSCLSISLESASASSESFTGSVLIPALLTSLPRT